MKLCRMMLAIVIAAALLYGAGIASVADSQAARPWHPCKVEDGSGQHRCVWDARHMGNGNGDSVLIRKGGTDNATYTVVSHRRAHRLIHPAS